MRIPAIDRRSEWIPSPRRVRVRFGGETVADSVEMMLLRQHGFLPVYYFPERDVRTELLGESPHTTSSPYKGSASYFDLRVGDRVAPASVWTYRDPLPGSPPTADYLSFHWHAMDAWLEEDDLMAVHARDPYLRADTLRSSRHVVVRLGDKVVADTTRPVLLMETGLVTRYYIPPADVDLELFESSDNYSMCPYKGTARYRSFRHDGLFIEDAAWYYPEPLRDVVKITNHMCFWNERPHTTIEADGVELPRLGIRHGPPGSELLYPSRRFFIVPPPPEMSGAATGELQHDHDRPNGRAEGPPDDLIDMDVERAGGRRPASVAQQPAPSGGTTAQAPTSLFFTFGRSETPVEAAEVIDLSRDGICERSLRRIRAFSAGTVIADSRNAILRVADGGRPEYWFPRRDVRLDLLSGSRRPVEPVEPPPGLDALRDHIALEWDAADAWFEEDDEIHGHPRVPYHRVDAENSSRHLTATLNGTVLADTAQCVAVFETDEPARFYIPRLAVDAELAPSGRAAWSPYLGRAQWLNATIGRTVHTDVAWTYADPIPECPKIADLICFDESKAQVVVDPPAFDPGTC